MSQLRHNPANAVTQSIERIVEPGSRATVRKRLGRTKAGTAAHWQASDDPRHWNYWRREAEAYRSGALACSLDGTGLGRPDAECVEQSDGIELLLEYVDGRPGTEFGLADHVALATGLGRWQAAPPLDLPWTSTGFLRDYSMSRPAPDVLDDDAAWTHPLIADCLPPGLRAGWTRLTRSRDRLLVVMESLPRVTAHLDLWPANEIRRPGGEIVLLDWSFCGDGAIGEDVGNHVPDSVFDLFWPGDRLAELDRAVYDAYIAGLREGGWTGDERLAPARHGRLVRKVHVDPAGHARRHWPVRPSRVPPAGRPAAALHRTRSRAVAPRRVVRRGAGTRRRPGVMRPGHRARGQSPWASRRNRATCASAPANATPPSTGSASTTPRAG